MRIVVELKRGEQAEVVLNNLYKHTQMQVNFGVIMLAIVNGQPRELGLLDFIRKFIDHRLDVVRRRTDYLLRKSARPRAHPGRVPESANHLDPLIALIRASKNPREAREALMGTAFTEAQTAAIAAAAGTNVIWDFSERQAQAIIELQLQRLTGMEQQKILDELAEIQRQIAEYLEILGSEKVLYGVIIKELKDVQRSSATNAAPRSSKTQARFAWKTWCKWKTSR